MFATMTDAELRAAYRHARHQYTAFLHNRDRRHAVFDNISRIEAIAAERGMHLGYRRLPKTTDEDVA